MLKHASGCPRRPPAAWCTPSKHPSITPHSKPPPPLPPRTHLEARVVEVDVGEGAEGGTLDEVVDLLRHSHALRLGPVRPAAQALDAVGQQVLRGGGRQGGRAGRRWGAGRRCSWRTCNRSTRGTAWLPEWAQGRLPAHPAPAAPWSRASCHTRPWWCTPCRSWSARLRGAEQGRGRDRGGRGDGSERGGAARREARRAAPLSPGWSPSSHW